ncbi:hypothetical protein niasHS_011831 [Heterodera schachtii]|uniref:Uncharacterized protein n=1 Tax=Heterodera schachtii TaxID=97005 RepID=A0ABD2IW63_HETSC
MTANVPKIAGREPYILWGKFTPQTEDGYYCAFIEAMQTFQGGTDDQFFVNNCVTLRIEPPNDDVVHGPSG